MWRGRAGRVCSFPSVLVTHTHWRREGRAPLKNKSWFPQYNGQKRAHYSKEGTERERESIKKLYKKGKARIRLNTAVQSKGRKRGRRNMSGPTNPVFGAAASSFLQFVWHPQSLRLRRSKSESAPLRPSSALFPEGEDGKEGPAFDPSAVPPFTLGEIRAAIPKHCWVKNSWRSLSYVVRDATVVLCLAACALHFDKWSVWPLYWLAQGTMFWALFVLGHDCGHGSFSDCRRLNSVIGHLTHSFILVPYNGWRISHRTHHQNHGHVERDESWHPVPEKIYRSMGDTSRKLRFGFPWPLFVYPVYLWLRGPGKAGSHFNPRSDLFAPDERRDVITSTLCWAAMASVLIALTFVVGPLWILKLYVVPYWVFVAWLDAVTYLHHHGYDKKVPWYRGKEWNYLRGALSTIDRDYGWFNNIHHDIGTHVIHHLFPQIPHYNLVEATKAAKVVLGKYYREPQKSGPFPIQLLKPLMRSLAQDHYVKDAGDIVFYEIDTNL